MILNEIQEETITDQQISIEKNTDPNNFSFCSQSHFKTYNSISANNNTSVKILKSFYKKDAVASVTGSFLNLDNNSNNNHSTDFHPQIASNINNKQLRISIKSLKDNGLRNDPVHLIDE